MAINFQVPYLQSILIEGIQVDILRLDTIHPIVSGNKWYKLKGYLDYIIGNKYKGFVTFGGAYSNHLHAAAFAGRALGLEMVGIVRGKDNEGRLNATLTMCQENGMKLQFVERSTYREKEDPDFIENLKNTYPDYFIIPEGGSGHLGQLGVQEIGCYIKEEYNVICVSVGSGTTLQGLLPNISEHQKIYGFIPMKNAKKMGECWAVQNQNFELIDEFNFGGFGKMTNELLIYMNNMYEKYQLPLDRVYTAKMFYGIEQYINRGLFTSNDKLLAIHTGGLQGNDNVAGSLVF